MLLAQSGSSEANTPTSDTIPNNLMNPPPHPSAYFQSPPSQKGKPMLKGKYSFSFK